MGWSGTEFFTSWCWGSESFSFLGPGGEAYFNFLGGRGCCRHNLLPVGQIYFTFEHIFLTKKRFSSAASEGLVNKLECLFGRHCIYAMV